MRHFSEKHSKCNPKAPVPRVFAIILEAISALLQFGQGQIPEGRRVSPEFVEIGEATMIMPC
jgi:hypothetical protein